MPPRLSATAALPHALAAPTSLAPGPARSYPVPPPAALAAAYVLLKGDNPAWANVALQHAEQLYTFGVAYVSPGWAVA